MVFLSLKPLNQVDACCSASNRDQDWHKIISVVSLSSSLERQANVNYNFLIIIIILVLSSLVENLGNKVVSKSFDLLLPILFDFSRKNILLKLQVHEKWCKEHYFGSQSVFGVNQV